MSKTVVYLIDPEKYFPHVVEIIKKTRSDKLIVYVTAGRPYSHIASSMKDAGIDLGRVFFIDCVSKGMGQSIDTTKPCIFLDGQQNLAALSIAINESIKSEHGEKILIIDSISTLLLYNDEKTISKFASFVVNKAKDYNADIYLLALASDRNLSTIAILESLADEVKKDGS